MEFSEFKSALRVNRYLDLWSRLSEDEWLEVYDLASRDKYTYEVIQESYNDGYSDGASLGYELGYSDGHKDGFEAGKDA